MNSNHFIASICLLSLCDELILYILNFIDLPDLLACSRTCHRLRPLALDPLLHRNRLISASLQLSLSLPHRPPLSSIRPPAAAIYLTPTLVAARRISRSLISIRLSRQLGKRPSVGSLVESNILPEECVCFVAGNGNRKDSGEGYVVSTRLVGAKRGLERERLKDGLRGWLSGRRREELEKREKEEGERSVKGMVRRFAGRAKGVERDGEKRVGPDLRWGKGAVIGEKRKRVEPTRAHVLGLRRFWEGVGRAAST